MDGQESVTKSAVGELRDAPWVSEETYKALLGRVIDAPTDADGNLLHVGDEVMSDELAHAFKIEHFNFDGAIWYARAYGISRPCSDLHRVMPDSRERIEADACKDACDYYGHKNYGCSGCPACGDARACNIVKALDLVRRCFALTDGEGR